MGALVSIFNSNELKDFEVAWAEKTIPEKDAKMFEEGQAMLEKCLRVKQSLEEYKGCKDAIKDAMSTKQNTPENITATRKAMEVVGPNAALCADWQNCAVEVANFLKDKLFPFLSTHMHADSAESSSSSAVSENKPNDTTHNDNESKNEEKKKEEIGAKDVNEMSVVAHQALCKQACELLDFLLTFDQLKMLQSQIQNDFSFYKRTLVKCDSDEALSDVALPVNAEKAGFISMFLAQALPMIKEVSTTIKADTGRSEFTLKMLATICNACVDLLRANKFGNSPYHLVILRAMVASFLIYDHANSVGAFQRRSLTKASKVVSMVCTEYAQTYGNKEVTSGLINVIKFSSLHINDEQTPQSIRRMLET